jgi:predicted enzyme related to lactoylglutathione lyase
MAPTPPNQLAHLELHTRNQLRASAFYAGLFGWRPELVAAAGCSYLALDLGERVGGGIVECGAERALWLPYVSVPDVTEAIERAKGLGARVLLSPREGPAGWRSVVEAPDGAEIAFWQSKPWRPDVAAETRTTKHTGGRR